MRKGALPRTGKGALDDLDDLDDLGAAPDGGGSAQTPAG